MRGDGRVGAVLCGRAWWTAALAGVALAACDPPPPPPPDDVSPSDAVVAFDRPQDDGRSDAVDASDAGSVEAGPPSDRGPLVPLMCPGAHQETPQVFNVDPRTNCPSAIAITHPYSSPSACDDIEACCNFPSECVFQTSVTATIGGPCGGLERQPPTPSYIADCRCVDGHVSCAGSGPVITNLCLDCPRDAGAGPSDGGR